MVAIGERLRVLRESIDISQAKLAKLCETTPSAINRYEHNHSQAPYKILVWYADYFDVSLDYIFGRTDMPEGKLYKHQPEVLKMKINQSDDFKDFIEACFDPRSPMNAKLKQMLYNMVGGEDA